MHRKVLFTPSNQWALLCLKVSRLRLLVLIRTVWRWRWVWSADGMILTGKAGVLREKIKICAVATLTALNLTWICLGSNYGLRIKRPWHWPPMPLQCMLMYVIYRVHLSENAVCCRLSDQSMCVACGEVIVAHCNPHVELWFPLRGQSAEFRVFNLAVHTLCSRVKFLKLMWCKNRVFYVLNAVRQLN
jgi:hypothetical protein